MSDDELRRLARAAEARPGDVDAGWAHARALQRLGDEPAYLRELVRLSRLGDATAADALDAWHPWPSETGVGCTFSSRARPLSRPGAPRAIHADVRRVVCATRRALIIDDSSARRALGPGGEVLWSSFRAHLDPVCTTVDGLIAFRREQEEAEVVWTDPASGITRSRPVDLWLSDLQVGGTMAVGRSGRVLHAYDLDAAPSTSPGPLWTCEVDGFSMFVLAGASVVVERSGGLDVLDTRSGKRTSSWEHAAHPVLVTVDARGAVLVDLRTPGSPALVELSLPDLRETWRAGLDLGRREGGLHALAAEVLLTGRREGSAVALVAHDRATGAERWTAPLHEGAVIAVASDVVYVLDVEQTFFGGQGMATLEGRLGLPRGLHPRVALRALDLATGALRFDLEVDRSWHTDGMQVVPLDRAVVVRTPDGRLLRIDDLDVHAPPA